MLQDAGEVECESVDERLNAMEDAFRSEIDHLTEEMRTQKQFLETSLENELGNCIASQNSLLAAQDHADKRLTSLENGVKESYDFLNDRTTSCEKQCQTTADSVSELSSRFEARLATLEEAQKKALSSQIALHAQADKDHDRLVGIEKAITQLRETVDHQRTVIAGYSAQTSALREQAKNISDDRAKLATDMQDLKTGFEEIRKRLAQFSQFVTAPVPSLPSNVAHVMSQTPNPLPQFALPAHHTATPILPATATTVGFTTCRVPGLPQAVRQWRLFCLEFCLRHHLLFLQCRVVIPPPSTWCQVNSIFPFFCRRSCATSSHNHDFPAIAHSGPILSENSTFGFASKI